MPTYRLHDTTGDDLGLIEHPAPNVEPGGVVMLPDGREALVVARVEAEPGPLAGSLPATEICLRMRWRKTPGRLALSAPTDLRCRLPPRYPAKAAS
jgi:hypothetical protein